MTDLRPLNEENCPPGTRLVPEVVTYTEDDVLGYLARTAEPRERYERDGVLLVPPGLLLVEPMRMIHANFHYETGVHTASDLDLRRLPAVGSPVAVEGEVRGYFERNGNRYVTLTLAFASDGDHVATIAHTSIYALRKAAPA